MYIENGTLYVDEYVIELEKHEKETNIFVYFIHEGFRYDDNVTHEVHIDHNPYTEEKEGYTFLGSLVNPPDPDLLLAARKKDLFKHLIEKTNELAVQLKSGYSDLEEQSWEAQETEARALMAVKTPTIDALCAARGCTRDYLANKIIENADNARLAGIGVLSWQQNMEVKIKNMDVSEFAEIWNVIDSR